MSVKGGIATDIPTAQASSLSPVLLANASYSTFYILLYILLFTLALVDFRHSWKKVGTVKAYSGIFWFLEENYLSNCGPRIDD